MASRRTGSGRREDRIVEFTWWIHKSGYHLQDSPSGEPPRHFIQVKGYQGGTETYRPLEQHTGLFREFADMALTPQGCVAFADKRGLLFGGHGRPEACEDWLRQAEEMRQAVELLDLVRAGNVERLGLHIAWSQDELEGAQVLYRRGPDSPRGEWRAIGSERMAGDWFRNVPPGDVVLPALFYIRSLVNRRLDQHVSPHLNYDPRRLDNPARMSLDLEPRNLLGALWLQFAQAVGGNRDYRRCEGCQRWFEVSSDRTRSDKKCCSAACRMRAHRAKPALAVKLRAEGKSVKEIADVFEVNETQVKEWLKADNKRKG